MRTIEDMLADSQQRLADINRQQSELIQLQVDIINKLTIKKSKPKNLNEVSTKISGSDGDIEIND